MTAVVNGEPRKLPAGTTISSLLDALDIRAGARGVAVAVDAEVVPRGEWDTTEIGDGAHVEVLHAIQGG